MRESAVMTRELRLIAWDNGWREEVEGLKGNSKEMYLQSV